MKATLTARLNKLEGVKEAGRLAILFASFPDELCRAEEKAARLEAEGRRVILVRWQWNEAQGREG